VGGEGVWGAGRVCYLLKCHDWQCFYRLITIATSFFCPYQNRRPWAKILATLNSVSLTSPAYSSPQVLGPMGIYFSPSSYSLQHHNPNPTTLLTNIILPIHPASNRIRLIIIQIIMQLSIARTKLLLLQK